MGEAGSDQFDAFLGRRPRALISRLVVIELRCLLKRRLEGRQIDARYEQAALADFADDVRSGHFQVGSLTDRDALTAYDLVDQLVGHPLRTLDALHLAIAQTIGVKMLATADLGMARAAECSVSPW